MSYIVNKTSLEPCRQIAAEAQVCLELASAMVDWGSGTGTFSDAPAATETTKLSELGTALTKLEATVAKLRAIHTANGV